MSATKDSEEFLLGIDIGTQGVKAGLVSPDGNLILSASKDYPTLTPLPGWAEQDPLFWWKATVEAVREICLNNPSEAKKISGVGLSGQMHGSVVLDRHNRPLRPCILWCDQRTSAQCEKIREIFGDEGLISFVSNPALPGFTAPKLLWIREHEPDVFRRISKLLLPKDYVNLMLTGNPVTDFSDASGTLLFDVKNKRWSDEIIVELGLPESIFPEVIESVHVAGYVSKDASQATGIPEGIPVAGGAADNAASAVGMGVITPDSMAVSIGSSGTVLAPTKVPLVDPEMRIHSFCHAVPDTWYLMGVMLSAGLSLRWFRDTLGEPEVSIAKQSGEDPYSLLDKTAQNAPPGSGGLIFLPYLSGERTPHADPNARGVLFGMDLTKRRPEVVRSIMEGVVFGLKDSLILMSKLGVSPKLVVSGGGGSRSELWRRIQADVFGFPITACSQSDTAMFGAALVGGVARGVFADIEDACEKCVSYAETIDPDSSNFKTYELNHRIFKELYPALKDLFRKSLEGA